MAYGPAGEDVGSHTVVETSDTFVTVVGAMYGELYAFRVRALCGLGDTLAEWQSWSGEEYYTRPYWLLTLDVNDPSCGEVSGGGMYERGIEVSFTAFPYEGFVFRSWNDGYIANPRTVTLTSDTTFTAIFVSESGDESLAEAVDIPVVLAPNPAKGEVRVSSPVRMASVELLDARGASVLSRAVSSTSVTLPLAGLPGGLYLVAVTTERGTVYRKLVKL